MAAIRFRPEGMTEIGNYRGFPGSSIRAGPTGAGANSIVVYGGRPDVLSWAVIRPHTFHRGDAKPTGD